jgi:serine/threonine-protein kinase
VAAPPKPSGRRVSLPLIMLGAVVVVGGAGAVIYRQSATHVSHPAATTAAAAATPMAEGTVKIVSRPAGARVIVDGVQRGTAPLSLALSAGDHTLMLENGSEKRSLPLTIESGATIAQYVDLGAPPGALGALEVTADPAGARVTVDGVDRGTTPLLVSDLAPGDHSVTITNGDGTVTRRVNVTAGATASVMASIAPAGAAAGWVSIKAPFPLEIREGDSVLAAAGVDRVMLPVGKHQLDAVSTDLGFQAPLTVQVQAGKIASVTVTPPDGTLSINAVPWADVSLDGKAIGTTPIGNLSVPIGTHELVWKNPKFGERRQTVKVTAQSPARAGVDFTK